MCPVDRNGEQWSKPRPYKKDGSLNYDRKPPDINASFRLGKFSQNAQKKYWTTSWEEQPHLKPPLPKPPDDPRALLPQRAQHLAYSLSSATSSPK